MSSTRDRRSEEKVIYYQPAPQTEEQQGDLQQVLSFILAFAGMILKIHQEIVTQFSKICQKNYFQINKQQKICLWIGLFMILSNFANIKQTSDVKQMIINAGVIVMGMVSLYYWQPRLEEQQLQAQLNQQQQAAASEPVLEEKFEQ